MKVFIVSKGMVDYKNPSEGWQHLLGCFEQFKDAQNVVSEDICRHMKRMALWCEVIHDAPNRWIITDFYGESLRQKRRSWIYKITEVEL